MDSGLLIAINVFIVYSLCGPLVLFGIYVLFDDFVSDTSAKANAKKVPIKDPSLWTVRDIDTFLY